MEGKTNFYPIIEISLKAEGYEYYDGDRDIKGKTRQHRRKPDFVAVKENTTIIGEIKSTNEPPTSAGWRRARRMLKIT